VTLLETAGTDRLRADLERFLDVRISSVTIIPEGHSGFTYWVDLPGRRAVMRIPPPGARISGAADIPRQARIIAAALEAGLPVPRILAASSDPVIDGRPFYLLEAVDGERIERLPIESRGIALVRDAVHVLSRMQKIPIGLTGIKDESPKGLEGEVLRWSSLIERAPAQYTVDAPRLSELLLERRPSEGPAVLVHGDYHYGNMLFREGRLVSVLDWEIAQLGQPLIDLACLRLVARVHAAGKHTPPGGVGVAVSETELLAMYDQAPVADHDWYLALAFYKYASIYGYNLMLHLRGKRLDPVYLERTGTISDFISEGLRLLGGQKRGTYQP
jgi:aminoglycoside phosphotransferase (APT) family kinase protein